MKKKWIRYAAGAIGACIVAWIILLAVGFFYVQSQKEKLIASIEKDISQKISAKPSFDDLSVDFFQNFPGISISLKNVHLQDSLSSLRKKELLSVQHFYLGFGLFDLLTGKKQPDYITLSNGNIYLFTDSSGNKNWNILKKQP
ncbi:MAG TPA: AsmA family protein, partial [Chitinophagaceae bacterium]